MIDERMDALLRRLDVAPGPDPGFVAASKAELFPLARAARARDATMWGRLRRDVGSVMTRVAGPSAARRLVLVGLLAMLLIASVVAWILIVGARTRPEPLGNGVLVLSVEGRLTTIDVEDGTSTEIGSAGDQDVHVSRSPDGRTVAYWRADPRGDQLFRAGIDGADAVRLAGDRRMSMGGCVDAWSTDSRRLATEVTVDGSNRILVVDAVSGADRFVTPAGVVAHCPLWSPDGAWIAFTNEAPGGRGISVIRADGTGMRSVSGDLDGEEADGPDTWSPDGRWIYFGTSTSIWRADVPAGTSFRLGDPSSVMAAPTSSPDGLLVSFIVSTRKGWDLYVANADGSAPRRLLADARNNGWSADGRFILARWTPPDEAGGLVLVTPQGDVRLVAAAADSCPTPNVGCDLSWGQPKP